jgi:anhydro-N-acetylmuramic acid kinase
MSGTSADGVDSAIVDICPDAVEVLAFDTFPYARQVRESILALAHGKRVSLRDICHLNFVVGEVFASAVVKLSERSGIPLDSIDLIGSHGQTICHMPRGRRFRGNRLRSTLQIGEPCVIAERTGVTTVADFRPRDMAAGGEGAPLVPYADYVLFRHSRKSRAVQNIGGIANVTYLPPGCCLDEIVAFDTGPGNMVIDRITSLVTQGQSRYDARGGLAACGGVNDQLLAELMSHRFLRRRPPKSTGREEFGFPFSDAVYRGARKKGVGHLDILATVTAFTAKSIRVAYGRFLPGGVDEVILCGGGARNETLVRILREELRPAEVKFSDEFGISADAKEAVSFAILARETLRGVADNVPSATGAAKSVILGKIVPGKCQ